MNGFCGLLLKSGNGFDEIKISPVLRNRQAYFDGRLVIWSEEKMEDDFLYQGHIFTDQFIWDAPLIRLKLLESSLQVSGSWIFASIDRHARLLTLSRDRIGGRSIYYVDHPAFFAFSTDIKSLFELTPLKPELNYAIVFDYFMQSEFDGLDEKLFSGIKELPPASILSFNINEGTYALEKYFTPDFEASYSPFDEKEGARYISGLRSKTDLLFKTQINDGKIGSSLLSGGLDSSLIAIYAAKYRKSDWQFFTAGFSDDAIDESQEAKEMLAFLKMDSGHLVTPGSTGFKEDLEDLIRSIELPTFSAGTYIQYSLMKKLKALGVERILDGAGADALMAGHHYHLAFHWREMIANRELRAFFRETRQDKLVQHPISYLLKNELKYNTLSALPKSLQLAQRMRYFPELNFINKEIREAYKARFGRNNKPKYHGLNELLFHEYYGGSVRKLLRYVHKCGDRFDVSVHFPFSESSDLMEYMFAIPGNYKIHAGKLKYLAREAFKDELPERLYKGEAKKGLLSPNNQWLRDHREYFRSLILDGNRDVFDLKAMEKGYDQFFNPQTNLENYRIFKFISFALWRETFKI